MLNAYQLRLKYKNKYRLKVASFFLDTLYYNMFIICESYLFNVRKRFVLNLLTGTQTGETSRGYV